MKPFPKSTRSLPQLALIILLLMALSLSGCRAAVPQPGVDPSGTANVPGQPTLAAGGAGSSGAGAQTAPDGGGTAGEVPTPLPALRPTTPALPALADAFPFFEGLYWTAEVGVEPAGPESVRLVSGMPCTELVELLSSGEWRAAQRALPKPEFSGLASALVLLEKDGQKALVNLKDYQIVEIPMDGAPPAAATLDPRFQGCAGLVQILPIQEISATGGEPAEGPALQYPLGNGCLYFDQHVNVSLYYEGPGDFRASVSFTVPEAPGEYTVDDADLSLEIMRTGQPYVERFAEYYAAAAFGQEDSGDWGSEYWPESENAGGVTVTAARPLAGQIHLTGFAGDTGPQTFTAPFRCPE